MSERKLRMLNELEDTWRNCVECSEISARRSKMVHWRGNPEAKLALVGEAPGAEEDRTGLPFVGPAGILLDELLREAELDPAEDVFICNLLACRPPGNRQPHADELRSCSPRLHWMLGRIVQPKVLLLLGATAAKLTGVRSGLSWHRGEEKTVEIVTRERDFYTWPAVITYHPSYYLRTHSAEVRASMLADIAKAQAMSLMP